MADKKPPSFGASTDAPGSARAGDPGSPARSGDPAHAGDPARAGSPDRVGAAGHDVDTSSGTQRRRARILCLRAIYQWDVIGDPLDEQARTLQENSALREDVRDYAVHLVSLVHTSIGEIDALLTECLTAKWSLDRLASVDRAVLRMGTAELLFSLHVPTNVILNECIEIAKKYGSQEDTGRFVNGVLDQIARRSRGKL